MARNGFQNQLPVAQVAAAQVRSKLNDGIALQQQGRFEQAIAVFADILKVQPQNFDAVHLLGVVADQIKNHQLAADLIAQAIAINPKVAEPYFNRGNALASLNRLDEAIASYDKAIDINRRYVDAHCNRGIALQRLGRLEAAIASYDKAIRFKTGHVQAQQNRAIALQELGRYEEALAGYRRVSAFMPDNAAAHYNSGVALHHLERYDEALVSYDRALALDANYAEAYANRGVALHELARSDEALASYDRAIGIIPEYSEAYFNRANTLTDIGQLESAIAGYRQAIEANPAFAEAGLSLGHALYSLDDVTGAMAAYRNVFDADPADFGRDAGVHLAVQNYLDGKRDLSRAMLDASCDSLNNPDPKRSNVSAYWRYLDRLLLWWRSNEASGQAPAAQTLCVVGESHTLSAHGMQVSVNGKPMLCAAELIYGAKQWHLGRGEPNKYKRKFEAVMARLPRGSNVMLVFGEIDCRHDEGIIKAWQKTPDRPLNEIVQATIDPYVHYVRALAARFGHRPILCGVPATNIGPDALAAVDAERFVEMLRLFNATLKQHALAANMGFLDVFALTDRGDGIAAGDWHIETHHLLPSALPEAFGRYYIQP